MNKRSESTLKVTQHEMYRAGKTKMRLKTNSTEFMAEAEALCLFTSSVHTQRAQVGVEMPRCDA